MECPEELKEKLSYMQQAKLSGDDTDRENMLFLAIKCPTCQSGHWISHTAFDEEKLLAWLQARKDFRNSGTIHNDIGNPSCHHCGKLPANVVVNDHCHCESCAKSNHGWEAGK